MESIQFRWQHIGPESEIRSSRSPIVVLAEIYADREKKEGRTLPIYNLSPDEQGEDIAQVIVESLQAYENLRPSL